jgi:hypothetical protein
MVLVNSMASDLVIIIPVSSTKRTGFTEMAMVLRRSFIYCSKQGTNTSVAHRTQLTARKVLKST